MTWKSERSSAFVNARASARAARELGTTFLLVLVEGWGYARGVRLRFFPRRAPTLTLLLASAGFWHIDERR